MKEFYITDDGIQLHAKLDMPEEKEKCPLVIVFHGLTGNMEERHITAVSSAMNEIGFATLRVELYGHGKSGGTFEQHNLMKWINNAMTVTDYAKTLDFVTDLYICGHSQGGLLTMLAAGIGNIHGKYPANWQGLSFETLDAIQQKTGVMPLVLHGGTGIPADMIKKAIDLGVSKINVNTECQLSFADATRKYIEAGKDLEGKGFDPRKLLAPGAEAIKATVKEKMELFGSVGKAE